MGADGDLGNCLVTCHRCGGTGVASLFDPMRPGLVTRAPARRRGADSEDGAEPEGGADPEDEPWAA